MAQTFKVGNFVSDLFRRPSGESATRSAAVEKAVPHRPAAPTNSAGMLDEDLLTDVRTHTRPCQIVESKLSWRLMASRRTAAE